jgi:hypothetical protein
MNGTTPQGLPQKLFRAESRNPVVKSPVMPRDPHSTRLRLAQGRLSASLRMTVLMGADSE